MLRKKALNPDAKKSGEDDQEEKAKK